MSIAWIDTGKPVFAVLHKNISSNAYHYIRFLGSAGAVTTCMKIDEGPERLVEVYRRKPGIIKGSTGFHKLLSLHNWQLIWQGKAKDFPGMTKDGYPKGYKGPKAIKAKKKKPKEVKKTRLSSIIL